MSLLRKKKSSSITSAQDIRIWCCWYISIYGKVYFDTDRSLAKCHLAWKCTVQWDLVALNSTVQNDCTSLHSSTLTERLVYMITGGLSRETTICSASDYCLLKIFAMFALSQSFRDLICIYTSFSDRFLGVSTPLDIISSLVSVKIT